MKNVFFAIAAAMTCGSAFSQNTFPANGNVTIGGKLTVDSTVVFNDTLKTLGEGIFEGNVTFNGNINATGRNNFSSGDFSDNVNMQEDLSVSGVSYLTSGAILDGPLILDSLRSLNDANSSVLFATSNGEVQKMGVLEFVTGMSTALYSLGCITDTSGVTPSPSWSNGPNKIFTNCANVGVGTNSPLHAIDVRGTGYLAAGLRIGTPTASSQITNPALIEVETTSNNRPLIRMSHKSGNNAPQTRFRVENDGRIYCTSVFVSWADSIPVPDYVFKPEYKLMPLKDLKSYVAENSHLPNVPSEAEIKAEGISIEQMQMRLLEKVEELTLYIINLNDSKEELERKNEKLLYEIEALKIAISNK